LYNVLNRKHFIEGGILNDQYLLLSAVDEIGLNRQECQEFLDSKEGINEILQTVDIVHSLGIHSIPVLIINGGQAIVQGAAVADEVIDKLREVSISFHSFA
jgi:predicted DsbA family dithiol-disulfide isomerase